MVNDVAKLTRSLRRSVLHQRARTSLRALTDVERQRLQTELAENGRVVYTDDRGDRYLIERKPA